MKSKMILLILLSVSLVEVCAQSDVSKLAPPVKNGIWIQPAQNTAAIPVWGFVDGIRIAIAPVRGPRGLIRILTPHLGIDEFEIMNFIAIEPVPEGSTDRGLSELEKSKLDNRPGKRFWSANESTQFTPQEPTLPASGVISKSGSKETLTVYIYSEEFDNGAKVFVRIRFTSTNPYEFELATFKQEGSAPLKFCITTATMGNRARLRTLYLANGTKTAGNLWPDYKDVHFAPHDFTPLSEMIRDKNGRAYFIAAPNEKNTANAIYDPKTTPNWKYKGPVATQYWYRDSPNKDLVGVVNGRYCYWASAAPIPGGIAYENFELIEPFVEGGAYTFGITPLSPEKFIKKISGQKK